jgi:DNA polymerase III delta prime subunit
MAKLDGLWVEKYRPKTLNEMCLEDDIKQLIINYTNKQEIPNLLLVGKPGIGKTSLARIIVQDLLQCQYLYINASDENGIDTVRGKIMNFAQTRSIDGKIKVILLDEVDGFSEQGQNALRNTMEEHAKYTRFILTANYLHRIKPALQSRCQSIHVESSLVDVVKRCTVILKQENIKINNNDTKAFASIIKSLYPDIRKIIGNLQRMCASGVLVVSQSNDADVAKDILQKIIVKTDCTTLRQFIINNEDEFAADYNNLLKNMLNAVYTHEQLQDSQKQMLICIIAEHLYRAASVMDQEINAFHCCLNMLNVT